MTILYTPERPETGIMWDMPKAICQVKTWR